MESRKLTKTEFTRKLDAHKEAVWAQRWYFDRKDRQKAVREVIDMVDGMTGTAVLAAMECGGQNVRTYRRLSAYRLEARYTLQGRERRAELRLENGDECYFLYGSRGARALCVDTGDALNVYMVI